MGDLQAPDSRFTRLVSATAGDLPAAVVGALAEPSPGTPASTDAAGYTWASIAWGNASDRPLLLVHGVTSAGNTFWRIGPALAATGRHVVAVDLPGHGRTGGWTGRHRFLETATDLAAFIRAAGLARPDLQVLGHSWGGLVVANLPLAGIQPRTIVLLDPPARTSDEMESMNRDPLEHRYEDLGEAMAIARAEFPGWVEGDVLAKAEGLTRFDVAAVRSILVENGTWDAGLAALADPAAAGADAWYVRGEFATGSLIAEDVVPRLAARVGADHVVTIRGGSHSPHRMLPEATLAATLLALGDATAAA